MGWVGISLTYKIFLLNEMIRKIPDIKKTIKREREERGREAKRLVKVLMSVCKANKRERERKNRDLQHKVEKKMFVFCDGEKDLFSGSSKFQRQGIQNVGKFETFPNLM
jgi:hypothetical protein